MINAQLARESNFHPKLLLQSEQFWAEQKIDGQRMLLLIEDGKVQAFNRKGTELNLQHPLFTIEHLPGFNGKWHFDGEFMNEHYYVFDLLHAKDRNLLEAPYEERRKLLEQVFLLMENPAFSLLPVAKTEMDKSNLYKTVVLKGLEGLVFKSKDEPYLSGKFESNWYKLKNYDTVDTFITEIHRGDKELAVSLGLYDTEGDIMEVSGLKIHPFNMKTAKVGDVVEVKYLYATETGHLYIPTFKRFRDDKTPEECYTSQLRYENKEVIKKLT